MIVHRFHFIQKHSKNLCLQPRFAGWKLDVTLDMESERILGFNPQLCTCCSIISPLGGGGGCNQDFSCNLFINRTRIIKHITHCGSKRSEFQTWNCGRPFCIKVLIAQVGCGCLYRVYWHFFVVRRKYKNTFSFDKSTAESLSSIVKLKEAHFQVATCIQV